MSEKIDINTADAAALATISGIGPALAERIIEYRQTVHPFEEVIELAAVPGISEKMVRSFEDLVTVRPFPTAVPQQPDELAEIHLLDAPEARPLLAAPEPPDGLLAAATATPVVDEAAVDEFEPAETANAVAAMPEPEAAVGETAVPPSQPQIEALPLAATPEPDLTPDQSRRFAENQNEAWEAKARQRGCLTTLLGATFGAILGAVLTLAILAALNQGTLSFAASDFDIQQRLNSEIISRTNELNRISTRISVAATQEAASNQSLQDEFATANETLEEAVAGNEENISYQATRSGELALQIEEVAGAADTFTNFLDGLRGLLNDLEDGTATPTPAPRDGTTTPTPTPFSSRTPTTEPEAGTAVAPTAAPTRTPQPTATSFTFPTNTPAPQP